MYCSYLVESGVDVTVHQVRKVKYEHTKNKMNFK